MHELFIAAGALIAGSFIGYGSGLSLIKQAKAFSFFSFFPLLRIPIIAVLAFYLLQYSVIAFILFFGALLVTLWTTLFKVG